MIPLMRSPHPPEYTARGVMVGVFWAFTPLIGVQMYLVFLTWLLARHRRRFEFGLIVSLAWTWVTNVATMIPMYYAFYVTGLAMLGRLDAIPPFNHFLQVWQATLEVEGFFRRLVEYARIMAAEQGVPMIIGSIPYAFGFAWLAYRWSLKFMRHRHRLRAERRIKENRRQSSAEAENPGEAADHRV
ncbi:MAG: DUF2062 domain-containing protein [Rhodospirillales bacterium]|nr:MAG: DUF2062 domain-containing protein [Rhodospirillales bacterium]